MSSKEPEEKEIMPGVYLTDFRSTSSFSAALSSPSSSTSSSRPQPSTTMRTGGIELEEDDNGGVHENMTHLMSEIAELERLIEKKKQQQGNIPAIVQDAEAENSVEYVMAQITERENDYKHLVESTDTIRLYLKESPADEDLKSAVSENEVILVRKAKELEALYQKRKALTSSQGQAEDDGSSLHL